MNTQSFVAAVYPSIGNVSHLKLHREGPNSRNYLVKAERGLFVLKEPKEREPARIEKLCRILAFCTKKGVKAPEPVARKIGRYTGRDSAYLVGFSEGTLFDGSLAQTRSIAKELAFLHWTLAKVRTPYPYHPNGRWYRHLSAKEFYDIQERLGRSTFDKKVFAKKEMLKHTFAEYSSQRRDKAFQLVHYDMQPGNVLFQGKKVSVILDFDAMRRGDAMRELAFAAFRFALVSRSSGARLAKKVALFAEVYCEESNKSVPSMKDLQRDFISVTLERISYILRKHYFQKDYFQKGTNWQGDFEKQVRFLQGAIKI